MKCPACGQKMKPDGGLYVCENCKFSLSAQINLSTDVFICCTQLTPQGKPTADSLMAKNIYNRLKKENINAFYSPVAFEEYPENQHRAVFEAAIQSAGIIIITGTSKNNFNSVINSFGDKFKSKAIVPVYTSMQANDIEPVGEMFPAINYDDPKALDNICKDMRDILNLLESKGRDVTDADRKEKKKTAALVTGILLAIIVGTVLATYLLFIKPQISAGKDYIKAQEYTRDEKYLEAIDLYCKLGNYKDSVDLLGKIYSRYDGFYQDKEKMLELDLAIVNGVGRIKINEHFGSRVVSAKTTGKVKANIIEFNYEDSAGITGKGTIELLKDSIKLTVNSDSSGKICLSTGSTTFPVGMNATPIVTADVSKITQKLMISWLNEGTTVNKLKDEGYNLILFDEEYIDSDLASYRYLIDGTDITLEFLAETENDEMLLAAAWATAEFLIPEKIGKNALAFEQGDIVYWPGKGVYWSNKNYTDAIDTTETKIRKSTTYTMVSKTAYERNAHWQDLQNAVLQRNIALAVGSTNFEIQAENNERYLVSITDQSTVKYYSVDKNTFESDYITKLSPSFGSDGEKAVIWKNYSDLFSAFLTDSNTENTKTVYRVRKSADDADSQIGAFTNKDNAIALADSKKNEGYKVYDKNGNLIYKP